MDKIKDLTSKIRKLKKNSKVEPAEVFKVYDELIDVLAINDYEKSIKVCNSALSYAVKIKSKIFQAEYLNSLGKLLIRVDRIVEARRKYKSASLILKKLNESQHLIGIIQNIGITYVLEGKLKKGIEFFFTAAELANESEAAPRVTCGIYANIGAIFSDLKLHKDAEKYLKKGLALAEKAKIEYATYKVYISLGANSGSQGKFKEAKAYLNKSIKIIRKLGDRGELSSAYNALAHIDLLKKDYKNSFKFAIASLKIALEFRKSKYLNNVLSILLDICKHYLPTALAYEKLNAPINFQEILKLLQDYVETHDDETRLKDIYELYAGYYLSINNLKEVIKYKDKIIAIANESADIKAKKKIDQAKSVNEIKKKQDQLNHQKKLLGKERLSNKKLLSLNKKIKDSNTVLTLKTDELNYVMTELEKLAFITSHDLKEPLRNIKGFLQILKHRYAQILDKEAIGYIDFSLNASEKVKTLIDDLIHYLRLSTRKFSFSLCNLNEILMHLKKKLTAEHSSKTFQLDIDNALPKLNSNPELLNTLFYELFTNAIKFKLESKVLISVAVKTLKNKYILSVKDSGIGLNKSYSDKVFQIFTRLTNDSAIEGNGIGLSICKKIMLLHKGKVWYEANKDKGTTFYLEFPF